MSHRLTVAVRDAKFVERMQTYSDACLEHFMEKMVGTCPQTLYFFDGGVRYNCLLILQHVDPTQPWMPDTGT